MMFCKKIFHRFAVGDDIAVKSEFLSQQLCQKIIATGDGHAVPVIIAAHDTHGMRLLYDPAKSI